MTFDSEIASASTQYGVDAVLVQADVQHESNFDPFAIGDGGLALGLMQVHRVAAEDVSKATAWDNLQIAITAQDEPTAVTLGLDIGVAYLAKMLKEFSGDERLALMAFNQGPTVISRANSYAAAVLALIPKDVP